MGGWNFFVLCQIFERFLFCQSGCPISWELWPSINFLIFSYFFFFFFDKSLFSVHFIVCRKDLCVLLQLLPLLTPLMWRFIHPFSCWFLHLFARLFVCLFVQHFVHVRILNFKKIYCQSLCLSVVLSVSTPSKVVYTGTGGTNIACGWYSLRSHIPYAVIIIKCAIKLFAFLFK